MNHLLDEYWEDLKWEALITWERLSLSELHQVGGNRNKLEKLIQQKYGYSTWLTAKQVDSLIHRYDNLAFIADCGRIEEQIPKFWSDLRKNDIDQIHCSRIRLINLIALKNECTKERAMEKVSQFLRQFID